MWKIYAPVTSANGTWASVHFVNGVGETNNPALMEWFVKNGYRVEEVIEKSEKILDKVLEKCQEPTEPDFDRMTPNELRDWMRENGYASRIKNIRNKEKLLEILRG